jgi:hypothetical protein
MIINHRMVSLKFMSLNMIPPIDDSSFDASCLEHLIANRSQKGNCVLTRFPTSLQDDPDKFFHSSLMEIMAAQHQPTTQFRH